MFAGSVVLACAMAGCGGGGGDADDAPIALASPPLPATGAASAPADSAQPAARPATSSAIHFTLASAATTSAGVYAPDGTLVRTLWRGEPRAAGTQQATWDLRDDAGRKVADATYEVRVLAHRVRHVWEGVVGNTSAAAPWNAIHRSFQVPTSLAARPGGLFYANGYNEGQSGIGGFDWAAPHRQRSALRHVDPFVSVTQLASDGARMYWVNGGGLSKTSFVAAFDIATGQQAGFDAGVPLCLNRMGDGSCYPDQNYRSVLGLRTLEGERATGIAVQRGGNLLAVAWAVDGRVQLFEKRSGRALGSIAAALNPGATNQLAMTPSGDLWVLGPQTATRYTQLATGPVVAAQVTGLVQPLAIAVDPRDDDAVWIADGGASQQLKRFDRIGTPTATAGQYGGMRGRSAIADDRFCFGPPDAESTALAVDETGAPWVVDNCAGRLLRVGTDGRVATQIGWVPASYVAAVDPGNPSRVFANHLEFEVDGTRPLDQPGSWRLVRDWLNVLPDELREPVLRNHAFGGFRLVRTLADGRTLAVLVAHRRQQLVELTADGRMRPLGALREAVAGGTEPFLDDNGDLVDAVTEGGRQRVRRQAFAGFDAQGRPAWGAPVVVATAPAAPGSPHYRNGTFAGVAPPRFPVTTSGRVVYFDPSVQGNEGFHLGAVARGGDRWLWNASPSGPLDGRGSFQTKAVDGSTTYGGNAVMALGSSIVYGYHGEFYRDLGNGRVGQANQWMHFHENGLFVGQFGVPSTRAAAAVEPGRSGNAFSPTLVRHAGRTYLYHNDESTFGGVHRWRIDGLDSIVELRGTGPAGWPINVR